jgi:hypothetical protein
LGEASVDAVDVDTALGAVLAARWAQAAAMAVEAAALCRLVAAYPECGLRGRDPARLGVEFELMAALGMSQRSVSNRLGFAGSLGEVPELAAALRAGTVDVPTGLMILDKVGVLADPALRREVVTRVLAGHAATAGGLTYAQLVAVGPAERVAICAETIEAIARAWARAGVPGTLDQLRFDALEALVTGADPARPPDRDHPDHDQDQDQDQDQDEDEDEDLDEDLDQDVDLGPDAPDDADDSDYDDCLAGAGEAGEDEGGSGVDGPGGRDAGGPGAGGTGAGGPGAASADRAGAAGVGGAGVFGTGGRAAGCAGVGVGCVRSWRRT